MGDGCWSRGSRGGGRQRAGSSNGQQKVKASGQGQRGCQLSGEAARLRATVRRSSADQHQKRRNCKSRGRGQVGRRVILAASARATRHRSSTRGHSSCFRPSATPQFSPLLPHPPSPLHPPNAKQPRPLQPATPPPTPQLTRGPLPPPPPSIFPSASPMSEKACKRQDRQGLECSKVDQLWSCLAALQHAVSHPGGGWAAGSRTAPLSHLLDVVPPVCRQRSKQLLSNSCPRTVR